MLLVWAHLEGYTVTKEGHQLEPPPPKWLTYMWGLASFSRQPHGELFNARTYLHKQLKELNFNLRRNFDDTIKLVVENEAKPSAQTIQTRIHHHESTKPMHMPKLHSMF